MELLKKIFSGSADLSGPLIAAVTAGDLPATNELLERDADPNVFCPQGRSLIWHASFSGNLPLLRLLLRYGAAKSINDPCQHDYSTPLIAACERGHSDILVYLLESGANANMKSGSDRSPLWIACSKGRFQDASALLRHRAAVDVPCLWGDQLMTPVVVCCRSGQQQMLALLLDNGADLRKLPAEGMSSPLEVACSVGDAAIARLLLDRGAPLGDGLTIACRRGHVEVVSLLLRATPRKQLSEQVDALAMASQVGSERLVRMLLSHDISPYRRGRLGISARAAAETDGFFNLVRLMDGFVQAPPDPALERADSPRGSDAECPAEHALRPPALPAVQVSCDCEPGFSFFR